MKTLIVTARAIYRDGRLIFYDSEEIPEDGTEVILHFEKQMRLPVSPCKSGKRGSLKGIWARYFPEDFDLDAELREIRKEWEKEMEDIDE